VKNRPKCSQTHFLPKSVSNLYPGEKVAKFLGYFRNLKELPKVNKFAQSGHPGSIKLSDSADDFGKLGYR
jgi:hypothetical protein